MRPNGGLGAEPFEFLTFTDVLMLYDPARAAPLDALCELMRVLGSVYTRAVRRMTNTWTAWWALWR